MTTSAFAAGKSGLRALSQSLAKEFGKHNIHVAHVSFFLRLFVLLSVLTYDDACLSFSRQSSMEVRPSLCYAAKQILLIDILRNFNRQITSASARLGLG